MILIIIVAIYALAAGSIRISRGFALTGRNARIYGLLLLVLLFPIRFLINRLILPAFPAQWFANRIVLSLMNWLFVVSFLIVIAFIARDRPQPEPQAPIA